MRIPTANEKAPTELLTPSGHLWSGDQGLPNQPSRSHGDDRAKCSRSARGGQAKTLNLLMEVGYVKFTQQEKGRSCERVYQDPSRAPRIRLLALAFCSWPARFLSYSLRFLSDHHAKFGSSKLGL
jgi:hypothetical protein